VVDGKREDSRRWESLGTCVQGGVQGSKQVSHYLLIALWVASYVCDQKYCEWHAPVQTKDLAQVTLVVTHTVTGENNEQELL